MKLFRHYKGYILGRLDTFRVKKWRKTHTKYQKGLCYYCEEPLTAKNNTLDHKQPLCLDGENNYNNTCACCNSCNQRKGEITEKDFLASGYLERKIKYMPG